MSKIASLAIDHAKAQGLLMLSATQQLDHVPFALAPSPFNATAFQQAQQLAPDFSRLMVAVANTPDFLNEILAKLGTADPFSQQLGQLYQQVYQQEHVSQPISLGIWRSDYLLDQTERLCQVEINLIASAFPAFASRISQLHRLLYPQLSDQLPQNLALEQTSAAFYQAWQAYGQENAVICFVQQAEERNRFDQLALASNLWQNFGIRCIFKQFTELANEVQLKQERLYLNNNTEIALLYFRAGYIPTDFKNPAIWALRLLLEQSAAIKCPSLPYQLAGMKIVQQQLSQAQILTNFIPDSTTRQRLQACFMPFLSLDQDISPALAQPQHYVLKPQREGGGHNLYGQDWLKALKTMSNKEKQAWVLMRLINSKTQQNKLVLQGQVSDNVAVISELGIYQTCLSDGKNYQHHNSGHLLRTKFAHHQEGGIAAGFAALDSPQLLL